MKRIQLQRGCAILLCLSLMLILSACSKNGQKETASETTNTESAQSPQISPSEETTQKGAYNPYVDALTQDYNTLPGGAQIQMDGSDLDQNVLSQDSLLGSGVTMINIWGTFCNPCIVEMPELEEVHQIYTNEGADFKLIGVVADVLGPDGRVDEDALDLAREIQEKTGVTYQNVLPGEQLRASLTNQVYAVPTTYFVDQEGKVIKGIVGSRTKDEWVAIIDEILENK